MTAEISIPLMPLNIAEIMQSLINDNPAFRLGVHVRNLGHEIDKYLVRAGSTIDRLNEDGWIFQCFENKVLAQHSDIRSEESAKVRLQAIGINPATIIIHLTWDDWFSEIKQQGE